jgi:hypothetical protein
MSAGLVSLEPWPLSEVKGSIAAFESAVQRHLAGAPAGPGGSNPYGMPSEIESLLDHEHARFVTSLEHLWWYYGIVEADDHGGHRQALGQYGRLVAEAVRRHRADERRSR